MSEPISLPGPGGLAVRAWADLGAVDAALARMGRKALLFAGSLVIVLCIVMVLIARSVSQPVAELIAAMDSVREGDDAEPKLDLARHD